MDYSVEDDLGGNLNIATKLVSPPVIKLQTKKIKYMTKDDLKREKLRNIRAEKKRQLE